MNDFITGYKQINKEFVEKQNAEFDEILNRAVNTVCIEHNVKVLGITGPSCSGKTTLAKKITEYYSSHGLTLHKISLDDFFMDFYSVKETLNSKTTDFDSPATFDTEAFMTFIQGIRTSGRGEKPVFDFLTGGRAEPEVIEVGDGDILIFEGIQLLYPQVEKPFHEMGGESIFVFAKSGIRVGDMTFSNERVRFLRRLVRDCNFRASSVELTFDMWSGVRKNEEENIFPYVDRCDIKIDTTQAYELNILKPYLEKYLLPIESSNEYYGSVQEILASVSDIVPIDSNVLPESSIYKEFV